MPEKLFFNTGIPVSLWFVSKDRHGNGHRARKGEVLFIDARQPGHHGVTDVCGFFRTRKSPVSRARITRGAIHGDNYSNVEGFCKAATISEIQAHDYILTPGRYVGTLEAEADSELIEDKIGRLTADLFDEFDRGRALEQSIRQRLGGLVR